MSPVTALAPGAEATDEVSVPVLPGLRMIFRLNTLAAPNGARVVEHPDGDCWGVFHADECIDSFGTFMEAWVAAALMPVYGHGPN